MIKLTRQTVIRQEIDAAIRLLFSGSHPIPVHVLAWAAVDVLRGVAESRGARTFRGAMDERIVPEHFKEWRAAERAAYNFAKHADADPEGELDGFNPELPALMVLAAVTDYGSVYRLHTIPMVVFKLWATWWFPNLWKGEMVIYGDQVAKDLGDPKAMPFERSFDFFNELLLSCESSPERIRGVTKGEFLER